MKKRCGFIVLVCIFVCFHFFVAYGATRVIGKAIPSDIIVDMNGVLMPSYTVNGEIGIIAEDLEHCGFTVDYDNEKRMLVLNYKENQITTQSILPETKPVTLQLYETDVQTLLECSTESEVIPSYNVGGKTIILIKDMDILADMIWSDEKTVSVEIRRSLSWTIDLPHRTPQDILPLPAEVSEFRYLMTKQKNGTWHIVAENEKYLNWCTLSWNTLGRWTFGIKFYDAEPVNIDGILKKLKPMINKTYDSNQVNLDTTFANEHMQLLIDGKKMNVTFVEELRGNGTTYYDFYFEGDVKNLDDVETVEILFQ